MRIIFFIMCMPKITRYLQSLSVYTSYYEIMHTDLVTQFKFFFVLFSFHVIGSCHIGIPRLKIDPNLLVSC